MSTEKPTRDGCSTREAVIAAAFTLLIGPVLIPVLCVLVNLVPTH